MYACVWHRVYGRCVYVCMGRCVCVCVYTCAWHRVYGGFVYVCVGWGCVSVCVRVTEPHVLFRRRTGDRGSYSPWSTVSEAKRTAETVVEVTTCHFLFFSLLKHPTSTFFSGAVVIEKVLSPALSHPFYTHGSVTDLRSAVVTPCGTSDPSRPQSQEGHCLTSGTGLPFRRK